MLPMTKLASILALSLLAACASSIDRSVQLRGAKLVAGVSTKSDVVNMIGLPAKIDRDEAKKLEIWQYTGKAINSSSFVPLPILNAGDIYGVTTRSNIENQPVTLICVFDEAGRLLDIIKPTQGDKK